MKEHAPLLAPLGVGKRQFRDPIKDSQAEAVRQATTTFPEWDKGDRFTLPCRRCPAQFVWEFAVAHSQNQTHVLTSRSKQNNINRNLNSFSNNLPLKVWTSD